MKILIIGISIFGLFGVALAQNITTTTEDANDTSTTVETTVETTASPVENTTVHHVTTSLPTTTTPLPTPKPRKNPERGKWVLKAENYTCLRLDAAIQFQFTYEQTDEKFVETYLNVPSNASIDEEKSSCKSNVLALTFDGNTFSLKFVSKSGKVLANEASITYIVSSDVFPGAKDFNQTFTDIADNLTLFKMSEGKSYLCKEESKITFTTNTNITATFTNIQAEAFKNSTSEDFSAAEECSGDKISDIVPIAVGCALAALVIIVLIAYLVGRQRTRQRGYQSV